MAVTLGDVNFRLGVDTSALDKSVKTLQRFGSRIDLLSRSTTKGAKQQASALQRQEKAAVDALRAVLNLNQKLRNSDGGRHLIQQANQAWIKYNEQLTKAQLNTKSFNRHQHEFKNSLASTNREFARLQRAALSGIDPTNRLNAAFKEMGAVAILVNGPLGGVAARLSTLGAISRTSGAAVAAFLAGIAAGVFILQRLVRKAIEVGAEFKTFEQILLAVTGSQIIANMEMERAIDIARRSGQSIRDVIPSYAKFQAAAQGTALQGETSAKIFESFSLVLTRLQAPAEQAKGVFRALEQILSKGQVQAEELRGQLGDRIPGAFRIAAKAVGVTTVELNKMLKAGEVISEEFLPKFAAEYLKAFNLENTKKIDNFRASLNNAGNAVSLLFYEFDKITDASGKFKNFVDGFTRIIDNLTTNMRELFQIVGLVTGALFGLAAPAITRGIFMLVRGVGALAAGMSVLNVAMLSNPITGFLAVISRIALAVTGAVLGIHVLTNALKTQKDVVQDTIDSAQQYIDAQKRAGNSLRENTSVVLESVLKQNKKIMDQQALLKEGRKLFEEFWGGSNVFQAKKSVTQIREFSKAWNELFKGSGIDPSSISSYEELNQALEKVGKQADKTAMQVKELRSILDGEGGNAENLKLSKEFNKTQFKILDIITAMEDLEAQVELTNNGGSKSALEWIKHLSKAREITSKLTNEDIKAMNADFGIAGNKVQDLNNFIANMFASQQSMNAAVKTYVSSLEKAVELEERRARREVIGDLEAQIRNNLASLSALDAGGTKALTNQQNLNRLQEQEAKNRAALAKLGYGDAEIDAVVGALTETSLKLTETTAKVKEQEKAVGNVDKLFMRLQESVKDYKDLTESMSGGRSSFLATQDLISARKIVRGLSDQELPIFAERLGVIGGSFDEVVKATAKFITAQREGKRAIQDFNREGKSNEAAKRRAERQAAALGNTDQAINNARRRVAAISHSVRALKDMEEQLTIDSTVRGFASQMEKAGVAVSVVASKSAELQGLLDQFNELERATKDFVSAALFLETTGADSFATFGDTMSETLLNGELSMSSFKDAVHSMINDIMKDLLRLTVTNPLKNFLFGTESATLGGETGNGGGMLGSIFSSLFSAGVGAGTDMMQPNAMGGARAAKGMILKRAAKGTMLRKPTYFNNSLLAGEAGDEAVMPLDTDSSGRMGVRLLGGGSQRQEAPSVYINIETPSGTKATQSQSQDNQGNKHVDIVIQAVNQGIVEGKMDKSLGASFGLSRSMTRR